MRKNIKPGSNASDRQLITYNTGDFGAGMIKDMPATDIPENALADGENVVVYPTEVQGRLGSTLYTSLEIQPLEGRTNLHGYQNGYIVTSNNAAFTQDDVGNFWVWPGTETVHYEIIRYIDGTHVEVDVSATYSPRVECYIRGAENLWHFHPIMRRWLFQWGNEFWVANNAITSLTRARLISYDGPSQYKSRAQVYNDEAWIVFNSHGIFIVDCSAPTYTAYRINIPIPNIAIDEEAQTGDTDYQYGYIYSNAALAENGWFRNRLTPVRILFETGTNIWNSAIQDWNDVWSEEPIGPGDYTYGMLECNPVDASWRTAESWNTLTSAGFRVNVNGLGLQEIENDFTLATSMPDVARIIQNNMRLLFPGATCVYENNAFTLTSGRVRGGTITYLQDALYSATNIATIMRGKFNAGAVLTTPTIDTPNVIGPLYNSIVPNTDPQEYQWHTTHYPVYRTMDKRNTYQQKTSELRLNDPQRFIWVKDLRAAGAFWARKFNGHVLVHIGQFEEEDVGSTIAWEDGSRDTILEYVAPDDVIIETGYVYLEESERMACCIGNGLVARASQTGQIVTRTHGAEFAAGDVGKTLVWSIAYASIITEYIDADNVVVDDNYDKDVQGVTWEWIYRYMNDIVSDDTLRQRMDSEYCRSRFLQPLPNCNEGIVVPGFNITTVRTDRTIRYSYIEEGYEHLSGFYNAAYQLLTKCEDDIMTLLYIGDRFVALCTNSWWYGPTNVGDSITQENTGLVVPLLAGLQKGDGSIGCFDWGSIKDIGDGKVQMITSEPGGLGLREFNGYSWGPNKLIVPNLGQPNWQREIEDLMRATCAHYDGETGYVVWGRGK